MTHPVNSSHSFSWNNLVFSEVINFFSFPFTFLTVKICINYNHCTSINYECKMKCHRCCDKKLSNEFPFFPLTEDCDHALLHCLDVSKSQYFFLEWSLFRCFQSLIAQEQMCTSFVRFHFIPSWLFFFQICAMTFKLKYQ